MEGIPDDSFFYFVQSYFVVPQDERMVIATTDYGVEFAAIVGWDNVFGVQFHPEKSQDPGLRLLKNFGRLYKFSDRTEPANLDDGTRNRLLRC